MYKHLCGKDKLFGSHLPLDRNGLTKGFFQIVCSKAKFFQRQDQLSTIVELKLLCDECPLCECVEDCVTAVSVVARGSRGTMFHLISCIRSLKFVFTLCQFNKSKKAVRSPFRVPSSRSRKIRTQAESQLIADPDREKQSTANTCIDINTGLYEIERDKSSPIIWNFKKR